MDFLPSADLLLNLEVADLGRILLRLVQEERGPRFTLSNLEMPLWNAQSAYPYQKRMPVGRALAEAWQWLQNEGLIMLDLDQPNGWLGLTRKGEKLKTAADLTPIGPETSCPSQFCIRDCSKRFAQCSCEATTTWPSFRHSKKFSAEREAVAHMYSGAIGYCKNPPSRREIERVSAAQPIGLASYLLSRVETMTTDQSIATEAA